MVVIKEKKGGFKFIFGMDLKKVSMLAAQTLSVFVAIIFLNFLGNLLKNTCDLKLDLSPSKVNSLSPGAKNYFGNYDKSKKIRFMVFEPYYEYAVANLQNNTFIEYCQAVAASNGNFKFEIVSPKKDEVIDFLKKTEVVDYINPEAGEERQDKGICLVVDETDAAHPLGIYITESMLSRQYVESFDDHLKGEASRRKAQANPGKKIVDDEYKQVNSSVFAYERLFVGALEKLSSKKQIKVAAVTGHNEHDFLMNEGFFNSIGAKIEKVNLEKGQLSPERQLLLVAAPKKDFSKEEIDKLDAFLNGGGKLLYFASATQQSLENLDQFLKSHGIEFSEGVVLNFDGGKPDSVMAIDLKKQTNAYTEKMAEREYPLVLNACRPMVLNGSAVQDGWKLFEVCRTPAKCVAATKESVKNMAELQKNAKAEYVMVGGAQKDLGQGKVAKIVAVSTENLLNGALISSIRSDMGICLTSNFNFIYSLLKNTSGQDAVKYMPMKFVYNSNSISSNHGMDGKPLNEDQSRLKNRMLIITMLGLPLLFMLVAIVMVILRRRKK